MRVLPDSNVFISAILLGRNCEEILELGRSGAIEIVTSDDILAEVAGVLQRKFRWTAADARNAIDEFRGIATVVSAGGETIDFPADPADGKVLSSAAAGKVDVIVTGDRRHLLPLKSFRGIPIVSPARFLEGLS